MERKIAMNGGSNELVNGNSTDAAAQKSIGNWSLLLIWIFFEMFKQFFLSFFLLLLFFFNFFFLIRFFCFSKLQKIDLDKWKIKIKLTLCGSVEETKERKKKKILKNTKTIVVYFEKFIKYDLSLWTEHEHVVAIARGNGSNNNKKDDVYDVPVGELIITAQ